MLDKCGNRLTTLTDLGDVETLKRFFNKVLGEYDDFSEIYDAIDDFKIVGKNCDCGRKKKVRINKIIGFVYTNKIIGLAYIYNGLQNHWKQKGCHIFS